MTKRAWLALCAAMSIPMLTTSCGSDEATDNNSSPGTGGTSEGGDSGGLIGGAPDDATGGTTPSGGKANAGSGGATGGSSTGGKAGVTGGTGGAAAAQTIGSECVSADSCGANLGCLLPINGVPHGLCTAECIEDADCPNDGVCLTSGTDTGICLERCELGDPGLEAKCHGRPDMACSVIFLPTATECTSDTDCTGTDEVCAPDGSCYSPATACFPQCGNDSDCPTDLFCDPGSGLCVEEEPAGDPDGTACDPELEEDTCLGRCVTFVDENSEPVESVCVTDCTYLAPGGCGWEDQDAPAPAFCLPRAENGDAGDEGRCYPLCDCNDDCAGDRLCYEYPGDPDGFEAVFGHRAVCLSPDDTVESVETCP